MTYVPLIYHPDYVVPLPADHRFPMAKFGQIFESLVAEFLIPSTYIFRPEIPPQYWIELVHDPNFVNGYLLGTLDAFAQRRIGLPWSDALVIRTMTAVGGTILTARLALEHGVAVNSAGGTHHAFPAFGSGFCIFNDFAIAARVLMQELLVSRVLIVDLDVHQGDGTAFIFAQDPTVFTFSMHCEKNFPYRKQASNLDVPLSVGTTDADYLLTLAQTLPKMLDTFMPDLVLYNAGVDPHQEDALGKLALTDVGIFQRDSYVLEACARRKLPIACVIGGGYDPNLEALVQRHTSLYRSAQQVFHPTPRLPEHSAVM